MSRRGKTILMLINDPPIPDPKDPSKLDDKMFKGRAMTYYGRWTYKYEIAAQKGAAAAVIIHETEPAAYPYAVVRTSWTKENFELDKPDKNMDAVQVRSWITLDVAKKLLADADRISKPEKSRPHQRVSARRAARQSELRAQTNGSLIQISQRHRQDRRSDPKLKDEWVIYTAHWDHLGRHPELQGDQIFNGAVDNASGDAPHSPACRRLSPNSIRRPNAPFCSWRTTAEEAGLLGAKYYAEHPLYPLEKTLADINIDSMNVWGKARDVEDMSGA